MKPPSLSSGQECDKLNSSRRVIVGVLSKDAFRNRRDCCRRTWFRELQAIDGIYPLFVIGVPTLNCAELVDDILLLPCSDEYHELPQKVLVWIQWSLSQKCDFLFKCDDDTYVHARRFQRFMDRPLPDYTGQDIENGGHGPYASGGAGYLLSRRAATVVVRGGLPTEGPEDVAVGRVLSASGIRVQHDKRFSSEPVPHPSPENNLITAHYIRDEEMDLMHSKNKDDPLFQIVSSQVAYGRLGLHGRLGYDSLSVALVGQGDPPVEFLSAHAPSVLRLRTDGPRNLFGFLDHSARHRPESPAEFLVNDERLGFISRPGQRTASIQLEAGEHRLEVRVNDIGFQHSCWGVGTDRADPADARKPEVRIVMPTSNRYVDVAAFSLRMLTHFWAEHPPVDVLRYEAGVAPGPYRQLYSGRQSCITWTDSLREYLELYNDDEFVVLMLDDYALCGPVRRDKFQQALDIVKQDEAVGAFYLTWMSIPDAKPYERHAGVVIYPPFSWSTHTQAALWRRSSLLAALRAVGSGSAVDFECRGSDLYNGNLALYGPRLGFALSAPQATPDPMFLDGTEKTHWPIPYHNIMHGGKLDPRHAAFRRERGWLTSEEL